MKRKAFTLISLALSFLFCLSLCVSANGSNSASVWDGTVASGFESGDGTSRDPYIIVNASQLAHFASRVNGGEDFKDKRIELKSDIDLCGIAWTPIGTREHPFSGTFMGRGHTVSGLNIQSKDASDQGFFGCIKDAFVFNLVLFDSYIECKENAGGIAGVSIYGRVESCRNYASIVADNVAGGLVGMNQGGAVDECINFGFVYSSNGGGIVGTNLSDGADCSVTGCRNVGAVVGGANVGGIVGSDNGESRIKNCINVHGVAGKTRVGGIVGYNALASIESCRNDQSVFAQDENSFVGGIAGENRGVVKNCYNSGDVRGNSTVGGIVGGGGNGEISCCYSVGCATGEASVGAIIGEKGKTKLEYCYYMAGGAAYKSGKEALGIGNAKRDTSEARRFDYETMKWGEAYEGFDFSIWTTGGNIDYNYPELNAHLPLDDEYVRKYLKGDGLRDSIGYVPPSDNEEPTPTPDGANSLWLFVTVFGGIALIAIGAVVYKRIRK